MIRDLFIFNELRAIYENTKYLEELSNIANSVNELDNGNLDILITVGTYLLGLVTSTIVFYFNGVRDHNKTFKSVMVDLELISNELKEIETAALVEDPSPKHKLDKIISDIDNPYRKLYEIDVASDRLFSIKTSLSHISVIIREYFTELEIYKFKDEYTKENRQIAKDHLNDNMRGFITVADIRGTLDKLREELEKEMDNNKFSMVCKTKLKGIQPLTLKSYKN